MPPDAPATHVSEFHPDLGCGAAIPYRQALLVVGLAAAGSGFVTPSPAHLPLALADLRRVVAWFLARAEGRAVPMHASDTSTPALPATFREFEQAVAVYVHSVQHPGPQDRYHATRAVDLALLDAMVRHMGKPPRDSDVMATAYQRAKEVLGFGDWWVREVMAHQTYQESLFRGLHQHDAGTPGVQAILAAAGVVATTRLMTEAERTRDDVFPDADAYVVTFHQAQLSHDVIYWVADNTRLGLAREIDVVLTFAIEAEFAITGLLPRAYYAVLQESSAGFLRARRAADALAALLGPRHWASLLACAQPFLDLQRARRVPLYTPRCLRA
jgi:hypothetical protein